jgi:hypothetical protein
MGLGQFCHFSPCFTSCLAAFLSIAQPADHLFVSGDEGFEIVAAEIQIPSGLDLQLAEIAILVKLVPRRSFRPNLFSSSLRTVLIPI